MSVKTVFSHLVRPFMLQRLTPAFAETMPPDTESVLLVIMPKLSVILSMMLQSYIYIYFFLFIKMFYSKRRLLKGINHPRETVSV